MNEVNPYAAPREATDAQLPLLPPERWSEVYFEVATVKNRWFERTLEVRGTLNAKIYYTAWSNGECVFVDHVLRGRSTPWHWTMVAPVVEFTLPWETYLIPARIDIAAGWSWLTLVRVAKFRLTIAGQVIYEQ